MDYPAEQKITSPQSVGKRNMPTNKYAGDVVKGPGKWDLDKSDMRRLNTEVNLYQGRTTPEELGRTSGVGSSGGKILPINK
jgi:hypothetical protein